MADGTSKPIEDVKTGDIVQATEAETGETEPKTVTATITGHGIKHLVKIVIDTDGENGTGTATITATDGHPFWVPELGQWLDATDLQPGQWLHTSAGTWIQITAIDRWTTPSTTVHNLTVSDVHTYYVLAGNSPVLVHNCGGGLRQLIGGLRNKANDTFIGRLVMGRPMEPWRSNRSLHRELAGEPAAPNATIRDLVDMQNGNGAIGYKVAEANGRSDEDLLASVFSPRDGQYIATHVSRPGAIAQGNHRAMQLIARAMDPNNKKITLDTEIFIHRVGQ